MTSHYYTYKYIYNLVVSRQKNFMHKISDSTLYAIQYNTIQYNTKANLFIVTTTVIQSTKVGVYEAQTLK